MPDLTPNSKDELTTSAEEARITRAVTEVLALAAEVEKLHDAGFLHGLILSARTGAEDSAAAVSRADSVTLGGFRHRDETPPVLRDLGSLKISRQISAAARQLEDLGVELDPRQIDIFQLAALLCRLVTGQSADAYLRSARAKRRVSIELQPVLDRALVASRADAFAGVPEFIAALSVSRGGFAREGP